MIQDLHSHTYYSYCGKDSPEVIIKSAIDNGLDMVGMNCVCDSFLFQYKKKFAQGEFLLTF